MTEQTTAKWVEIAECDKGTYGHWPGQTWDRVRCRIYRHATRARYRAVCDIASGNSYGMGRYIETGDSEEREYRANSLDDLMCVAIAAERKNEDYGERMTVAIRNAAAQAEDALDED